MNCGSPTTGPARFFRAIEASARNKGGYDAKTAKTRALVACCWCLHARNPGAFAPRQDTAAMVAGEAGQLACRTAVTGQDIPELADRPSWATHNLRVSDRFFIAMCDAIRAMSVRERDLYSPRRLVDKVLNDPARPLYKLALESLDEVCQPRWIHGRNRMALRIDTASNRELRDFRAYAEQRLGRTVSVSEAIAACIKVAG